MMEFLTILVLFALIFIWWVLVDIKELLLRLNSYVDFIEKKSPRRPLKDDDVVMVIDGHEITYAQVRKNTK